MKLISPALLEYHHAHILGIEVKYHENLATPAATHRARYSEVAEAMGCFSPGAEAELRKKPLQQIWRDHLLAGSLLLADAGYDRGAFVFLYPAGNDCCASALRDYQHHLADSDTFWVWTLENVVTAAREAGAGSSIDDVEDRYLNLSKIEAL